MRNSTRYKQKRVLLRARHIWKVILANLEIKFKKSFFSSESSQENVHGGVHSRKSYEHCLQLFRKELHYTRLSGFFQFFFKQIKWNKLPLPSEHSQENVHDEVHFWNSYRYLCSQILKKKLHCSHLLRTSPKAL